MKNNDKNKVHKFTAIYMSLGMCLGVSGGLLFGTLVFPDNMATGMALGIPVGMCIGMAIGSARDRKLAEKMMEITRIEDISDSTDKMIYTVGKDSVEKEYRVTERKMKEERFAVGDRIAEETDGSLVSLENK